MNFQIDFPVHTTENNPESQAHLEVYVGKFGKKCKQLLTRLVTGEKLKFADEVKTIGDLRRRALDLIQYGVPVQREFNGEIKEYFLKAEDIPGVRAKYGAFLLIDSQAVTQ